jgi:magnesium chelatase family protein
MLFTPARGLLYLAPLRITFDLVCRRETHVAVCFCLHIYSVLFVGCNVNNSLLIGPPGTGKSMLAKRLATILPPLTLDEALETTKIHSIVGLLNAKQGLVTRRPFRAPHHTASDAGLLGGNINPTPGEISLAHHGVLFLDELPEFKRSVLETMRQPLEEGRVTISRAAGTMTFPSQFMLVAAMNPTPDGKMPHESKSSPREIQAYLGRISGPLLDRIDLHVEVPAVKFREISSDRNGETSAQIRERVVASRRLQQKRFAAKPKITCNARIATKEIKEHCVLDEQTKQLLQTAMAEYNLSARAYDRILKVARTIADLAAADNITVDHISEAIQLRSLDRQLWG